MHKLAIVTSHPIQYQAPWFRALARVADLTVFFCHKQDREGQAAAGFGVPFEWDVPLLDGYEHRWLENRSAQPAVSSFLGCDTPELASIIGTGSFDACLVCGWYLKSYLQAIRACRRCGVPVLMRGDSQLGTRRSGLVRAAKYFPYRWLLGSVDGHLYVGQANRDYLRHYGVADSSLFFVPHFVDNSFFARASADARASGTVAELRTALGAGRETSVFVFAGKLIDKKRPFDFLEALARARARGADVSGLVVGSGPLGAELEQRARSGGIPVSFVGFRNQTELPSYFAAGDAFVLPSDGRETWGLVVNEAMACGLPALVSRAAGCARDLIVDGRTGFTFDVGDVDALAAAIEGVHRCLRRDADPFRAAVASHIAQYDVTVAVRGTLQALDSIVPDSQRKAS
jgi:glycosyltransferase involved in cell wall biosynthesis